MMNAHVPFVSAANKKEETEASDSGEELEKYLLDKQLEYAEQLLKKQKIEQCSCLLQVRPCSLYSLAGQFS